MSYYDINNVLPYLDNLEKTQLTTLKGKELEEWLSVKLTKLVFLNKLPKEHDLLVQLMSLSALLVEFKLAITFKPNTLKLIYTTNSNRAKNDSKLVNKLTVNDTLQNIVNQLSLIDLRTYQVAEDIGINEFSTLTTNEFSEAFPLTVATFHNYSWELQSTPLDNTRIQDLPSFSELLFNNFTQLN